MAARGSLLNRLAFSATVHCLTGCAIGEVLGMVIGTALGWGDFATIALAVVLAFFFGYSLTMVPLLGSGLALGTVLPLAFASDTISITISWRDRGQRGYSRHSWGDGAGADESPFLGQSGVRAGCGFRGGVPGQPLAHSPQPRTRGGPPVLRRAPAQQRPRRPLRAEVQGRGQEL
jgi:hypothetical protein